MSFSRPTYGLIVCPGHSGSTLLAMCLDSHPRVTVFGEFSTLAKRLKRIDSGRQNGLCSFCGVDCPVHTPAEVNRLRSIYLSRNRFGRWLERRRHGAYLGWLARKLAAKVVIDSSKDISWAERTELIYGSRLKPRYIFLIRDGRGVVASHFRSGRPADQAATKWKNEVNRLLDFKQTIEPERKIMIRYEELAARPGPTLEKVCRFLGLDYDPVMLDYPHQPHHIIGGNAGARVKVNLAQGQAVNQDRPDVDWYVEQESAFFVDQRWKTELAGPVFDQVTEIMEPELSRLGYRDESE